MPEKGMRIWRRNKMSRENNKGITAIEES